MWGKTLISREKEEKKPKYAVSGKVIMVPTNDILPNPDQPRREYSYQKLLELSQSMVENGLLHPLTITFREGRPMLVAGELAAAGRENLPGCRRFPASHGKPTTVSGRCWPWWKISSGRR